MHLEVSFHPHLFLLTILAIWYVSYWHVTFVHTNHVIGKIVYIFLKLSKKTLYNVALWYIICPSWQFPLNPQMLLELTLVLSNIIYSAIVHCE